MSDLVYYKTGIITSSANGGKVVDSSKRRMQGRPVANERTHVSCKRCSIVKAQGGLGLIL